MTRGLPILIVALTAPFAALTPALAQTLSVSVNGVVVSSQGSVPLNAPGVGQTATLPVRGHQHRRRRYDYLVVHRNKERQA